MTATARLAATLGWIGEGTDEADRRIRGGAERGLVSPEPELLGAAS